MQGRRTKRSRRSRSQKIFNIKASGASGTALTARIIYKNLSLFLSRLDKSTASTQFIKIIRKVGCKGSGSAASGTKTRFISISTFSYINLNNSKDLYNYINLCVNNFTKHMDQYSPITPNELYLNYAYINKTEYKNKFKYNSWAPKTVDFNDFEFPLTVDYKSLSNKVAVKHVGLTKYTQYKDCKGFKNANNTTFVVKNLISDANYEVNNVTLYFNKLTYTFTDMLNKSNGEITRSFSSSEQEISNNFKSSTVKNVGTIDPLINNGMQNDTKFLTLDCETYLVNKVQK